MGDYLLYRQLLRHGTFGFGEGISIAQPHPPPHYDSRIQAQSGSEFGIEYLNVTGPPPTDGHDVHHTTTDTDAGDSNRGKASSNIISAASAQPFIMAATPSSATSAAKMSLDASVAITPMQYSRQEVSAESSGSGASIYGSSPSVGTSNTNSGGDIGNSSSVSATTTTTTTTTTGLRRHAYAYGHQYEYGYEHGHPGNHDRAAHGIHSQQTYNPGHLPFTTRPLQPQPQPQPPLHLHSAPIPPASFASIGGFPYSPGITHYPIASNRSSSHSAPSNNTASSSPRTTPPGSATSNTSGVHGLAYNFGVIGPTSSQHNHYIAFHSDHTDFSFQTRAQPVYNTSDSVWNPYTASTQPTMPLSQSPPTTKWASPTWAPANGQVTDTDSAHVMPPPPAISPRQRPSSFSQVEGKLNLDGDEERSTKRIKLNVMARRPSSAEDIEAGLALAEMGRAHSRSASLDGRPSTADSLSKKGLAMTAAKSPNLSRTTKGANGHGTAEKAKDAENKLNGNADKRKKEKDGRKSCAECRRLKAKCDRVFPCSNCRRRGCALVCPDGDLSCMQGKRLVLASTEQLHDRVAQLEAALSQAYSNVAGKTHPLLAAEYLDGGFADLPADHIPADTAFLSTSPQPPSLEDHAGSPKDTSSSHSSFSIHTPSATGSHGPATSGRMTVESLLMDHRHSSCSENAEEANDWAGVKSIPHFALSHVEEERKTVLEDISGKMEDKLSAIRAILPPIEDAKRRLVRVIGTSTWFCNIVKESEVSSVYLPAMYNSSDENPLTPHKLACVLIMLAMDHYLDCSSQPDDVLIARYWDGVQQCFDTRFGWTSTIHGVQALCWATYFVTFGWHGARASNFYWLRQTTSAVLQLGLHKDPHPSLPLQEKDLRRRVFWEALTMDACLSISHGHRTGIPIESVEAKEPSDAGFIEKIKYQYLTAVKLRVLDIGCRPDSQSATWEQVGTVAKNLLQWDPSARPQLHCPILSGTPMPEPVEETAHCNVLEINLATCSTCHYKAQLFLYRPSLRLLIARIRKGPKESIILSDQDRETIRMTYNACHAIMVVSLYVTRTHPRLAGRLWSTWVHTLSASVSMAALAIWCGPYLEENFVHAAYKELTDSCGMIRENHSGRSKTVEMLLPVLQSMVAARYPQVLGRETNGNVFLPEGEDMLFALLGGVVESTTKREVESRHATHAMLNESSVQTRAESTTTVTASPVISSSSTSNQVARSLPMPLPEVAMSRSPPNQNQNQPLPTPPIQPSVQHPWQSHPMAQNPPAPMTFWSNHTATSPSRAMLSGPVPLPIAEMPLNVSGSQSRDPFPIAHIPFPIDSEPSITEVDSLRFTGEYGNDVLGHMQMQLETGDLWARVKDFYVSDTAEQYGGGGQGEWSVAV